MTAPLTADQLRHLRSLIMRERTHAGETAAGTLLAATLARLQHLERRLVQAEFDLGARAMTEPNEPRWVHTCSRCGVTEPTDRCEEDCPVCQVAMDADKAQPSPSPSAGELARKQRVVDAIGVYMSKPAQPPRRWRR